MDSPTVCCLMGNHNYSAFLEEAMRSILNQDYKNIILGVVDDASSDNSPEIIERIAREDSRVDPIYLKDGVGVAEARNMIIRKNFDRSHFFLIVDSDDVSYLTKVRKMLEKMLMSPAIVGCYGDYDIINMNTGVTLREYKEPYDFYNLQQSCVVHSSCMMSKEGLNKITELVDGKPSWFDKELHCHRGNGQFCGSVEDWDCFLRLNEIGLFTHIPEALSGVRVHNNNQSQIEKVNKTWKNNVEHIQRKAQQRALARSV